MGWRMCCGREESIPILVVVLFFLFLAILSTTFLKLQAQYNPLAGTISFSKFTFNDSDLYLECKTA